MQRILTTAYMLPALFFALALGVPSLPLPSLWDAGIAHAQAKKRPPVKKMSQFGAKKLNEAREELIAENWDEAKSVLRGLEQRRTNEAERALVYQFQAHIAQSNDDPKGALDYYKKTLDLGPPGIDINTQLDLQYRVANLYMRLEDFKRAAKLLIRWHRDIKQEGSVKKASESTYYALAVAFAQMDPPDWDKALKPGRAAYKLAKNGAKRSTLEILVQAYYNKKDYKQVARYFEELIERYPKESYFKQLSGIYSELDRNMDAMAVRQIAYDHGWLQKDSDIRTLAHHALPPEGLQVVLELRAEGAVVPEPVDAAVDLARLEDEPPTCAERHEVVHLLEPLAPRH